MKWNENFFREVLNSAAVTSIVQAKAEAVASAARASAPVDTGAYRASIRVEMVRGKNRVIGKVVAASDHGMVVESKHGTLGRALGAVNRG